MRLGYVSNGLVHHRLDDAAAMLAAIGYRALGLTLDVTHLDPFRATPAEVRAARATCARHGLAIAVETGARFLLDPLRKHEPTLVSADPAGRARRAAFYERAIELAAALGAPLLSLWSGALAPDIPADAAREWLVAGLRAVCERAEAAGVRVAFEPEPGMLIESTADALALLREVDRAALGLTIDLGHLQCVERPPLDAHLALAGAALIHVHADDIRGRTHHHLPIGEGDIDFGPLAAALRAIGYGGMVLVELSRDAHRAPEVARDAYRRLAPLLG